MRSQHWLHFSYCELARREKEIVLLPLRVDKEYEFFVAVAI